ncbi:MAG: hypothetical protein ACT4P6_19045 [Gemmatimonadaceae bacterium]
MSKHLRVLLDVGLVDVRREERRAFLQYRLKEVDGGTTITLRHAALGMFPDGFVKRW